MFVGAILLASLPFPVDAGRAPRHTARWLIPANPNPPERVTRGKGGYYPVGRLVPAELYRVSNDIVLPPKGIVIIPAGTLMAPLRDDSRSVCEIRSRRGSNFSCLSDTDGDGTLDTYFGTQVFNELFLGSIGDDGGFEWIPNPISLIKVDPKAATPQITIELKLRQLLPNQASFQVCVSTSWKSKYYSERSCVKDDQIVRLDNSGRASFLGQSITFEGLGADPPYLAIDHNDEDIEFSTSWKFP